MGGPPPLLNPGRGSTYQILRMAGQQHPLWPRRPPPQPIQPLSAPPPLTTPPPPPTHPPLTPHLPRSFTNITKDFRGTLDYVLYTTDSLVPGAALELPDESECRSKSNAGGQGGRRGPAGRGRHVAAWFGAWLLGARRGGRVTPRRPRSHLRGSSQPAETCSRQCRCRLAVLPRENVRPACWPA